MSTDTPSAPEPPAHENLEKCQRRIGYVFSDKNLLQAALTHASGAEHRLASNERLEFLGDAILGAVVCELLFQQYPEYLEGDLTKIKSMVVSRQTCAKISEGLGMQEFLILGKGMTTHPTSRRRSWPTCSSRSWRPSTSTAAMRRPGVSWKRTWGPRSNWRPRGRRAATTSRSCSNWPSASTAPRPTYQLLDEKGPDHSKCFKIAAQVGAHRYQPAWGRNKKEAEQRAARNALHELAGGTAPFPSDERPAEG